ncbi:hypothetical protein ACFE04_030542 [Oxalis oulophora]
MESQVVESPIVMDHFLGLANDEPSYTSNGLKESENPGAELINDIDLYLDDINDRLTVSRMVSDSVIKVLVNAFEQDAAEKIAEKERELAELRELKNMKHVMGSHFSDVIVEHDRKKESIGGFRNSVNEQLAQLKKDIDRVRETSSIMKMDSESELIGFGSGGILQENLSDNWFDIDKTLDSLRNTMESMYNEVDSLVNTSKASLCHWQLERDLKLDIEYMVISTCIRSSQQEFEEKLWEKNAHFYGKDVNWVKKIDEISYLRKELDDISRSLDANRLTPQVSIENGDFLHRKLSGTHISPLTTNGKHEEVFTEPENVDAGQLRHLSREELVIFFKSEMTKMKRNHEHAVHDMTEELFVLKREHLKERGSSFSLKKYKEMETFRKKLPDVILKLDEILTESEKLSDLYKNTESIDSLKNRVDFLLSENHELRGFIAVRKKEANHLSLQVSETEEKILKNSQAEVNFSKSIENLHCAIDDSHFEASIIENVNQCLLTGMMDQMKCLIEESNMQHAIMHEIYGIILEGAVQDVTTASNCTHEDTGEGQYDDLDMESILMQQLCGVVYKEAFREVEEKLGSMTEKYLCENELRISFEKKSSNIEERLRLELAEKEKLQQEAHLLTSSLEQKKKLVQETAADLAKVKEQMEIALEELIILRDQKTKQDILISSTCEEMNFMKSKLDETLKQSASHKLEISELTLRLEQTMEELRKAELERGVLLVATKEKQHMFSLLEAKEREHRKQIESTLGLVNLFSKLSADFECRVAHYIEKGNSKLKSISSDVSSLIQEAGILKRSGLIYKRKLERRDCDLQKAEAEVDVLGDEVEALLGLLEKIYIALDHYSPILQHYPGRINVVDYGDSEAGKKGTEW